MAHSWVHLCIFFLFHLFCLPSSFDGSTVRDALAGGVFFFLIYTVPHRRVYLSPESSTLFTLLPYIMPRPFSSQKSLSLLREERVWLLSCSIGIRRPRDARSPFWMKETLVAYSNQIFIDVVSRFPFSSLTWARTHYPNFLFYFHVLNIP